MLTTTSTASFVTPSFLYQITTLCYIYLTSRTSSRHLLVHVTYQFTSPISSRHLSVHITHSSPYTIESLLGQEFKIIAKARNSIKKTIINVRLSYKTLKAKLMCYILIYKNNTYIKFSLIICIFINKNKGLFRLRALYLRRLNIA